MIASLIIGEASIVVGFDTVVGVVGSDGIGGSWWAG